MQGRVEDKFMWVSVNGIKHKAVNYMIEPTKFFLGCGEHPKVISETYRTACIVLIIKL